MSVDLKPGLRLLSAVDSTELIVVKAPSGPVELTVGGVPPAANADARSTSGALSGHDGGVAIGKRYVDAGNTIELLCTKAGPGVPALGDELLTIKDAKPLPASD
ncbi:MAG TPA: hypothetical protein PLV68_17500 [Ilumatobacteraceae bacterium]|nr:hypothetical protein [Ilumatobacteraceae bacterium]